MMKITHKQEGNGGRFTLTDTEEIGYITYVKDHEGQIAIEHTIVHPAFEGNGYARQLLDAVIAEARAQGWKIRPVCSYVQTAFARRNDLDDVKA